MWTDDGDHYVVRCRFSFFAPDQLFGLDRGTMPTAGS